MRTFHQSNATEGLEGESDYRRATCLLSNPPKSEVDSWGKKTGFQFARIEAGQKNRSSTCPYSKHVNISDLDLPQQVRHDPVRNDNEQEAFDRATAGWERLAPSVYGESLNLTNEPRQHDNGHVRRQLVAVEPPQLAQRLLERGGEPC